MQYMTRQVNRALRLLPASGVGVMLSLSLVPAVQAATTVDVPVQALITPAPCTVALTGLTGGVLDLGSQTSESLSAAGAAVGGKSFNVSLTQCGGDIGTTIPTITVSGETLGAAVTGGDFLFRDSANSTAKNVGFIFHFGGTSVNWPDSVATTKKNLKNGSVITPTANTEGAVLPATWKTTPIPVGVAVSTGGGVSGLGAGGLQAKVTFTFDYQ